MLSITESLLFAAAFWIALDYRRAGPLLRSAGQLAPVTLEEQRTTEWLASIRPAVLAPAKGARARPGYLARRRASSAYPASHYARSKR